MFNKKLLIFTNFNNILQKVSVESNEISKPRKLLPLKKRNRETWPEELERKQRALIDNQLKMVEEQRELIRKQTKIADYQLRKIEESSHGPFFPETPSRGTNMPNNDNFLDALTGGIMTTLC